MNTEEQENNESVSKNEESKQASVQQSAQTSGAPASNLEKKIKFSWMNVVKQGLRNMKEDIDPVYKGAKMGVYALHGIPTWIREYNDGRMHNDSHGWAGLTGLLVGGTSAASYYLATTKAIAMYGTVGFGVLGIPLAATGLSYTREAFRRAKKSEHNKVIKARIQQKIDGPGEETYDLTVKDMLESYVTAHNAKQSGYNTRNKTEQIDTIDAYKELSGCTEHIFDKLFAYDAVGSKYELSKDLHVISTGSGKKNAVYTDSMRAYRSEGKNYFEDLVWDTVSQNNGSANIEWLGKVTAIYNPDMEDNVYYQVTPNKLWKK